MSSPVSVGRVVGILLLLQGVIGSTVNFALLSPAITGPSVFLTNAASNSPRLSTAALLLIVAGVLSIAIASMVWPLFRRHSESHAMAYFGLCVASLALTAVESASIMSMLSLSQEYVAAGANTGVIEALGANVRLERYWAHYTSLIIGSLSVFAFYAGLYRLKLIPRIISGIVMSAIVLQLVGLSLPFFGSRVNFYLLAPMGFAHLVSVVWLIARGFARQDGGGEYA